MFLSQFSYSRLVCSWRRPLWPHLQLHSARKSHRRAEQERPDDPASWGGQVLPAQRAERTAERQAKRRRRAKEAATSTWARETTAQQARQHLLINGGKNANQSSTFVHHKSPKCINFVNNNRNNKKAHTHKHEKIPPSFLFLFMWSFFFTLLKLIFGVVSLKIKTFGA